eukprot:gene1535-2961_t
MSNIRIRLCFHDSIHLQEEMFRRCWFQLDPNFRTISDMKYIIGQKYLKAISRKDFFSLSVDGFVLPPFEDIAILRDADVVLVDTCQDRIIEAVVPSVVLSSSSSSSSSSSLVVVGSKEEEEGGGGRGGGKGATRKVKRGLDVEEKVDGIDSSRPLKRARKEKKTTATTGTTAINVNGTRTKGMGVEDRHQHPSSSSVSIPPPPPSQEPQPGASLLVATEGERGTRTSTNISTDIDLNSLKERSISANSVASKSSSSSPLSSGSDSKQTNGRRTSTSNVNAIGNSQQLRGVEDKEGIVTGRTQSQTMRQDPRPFKSHIRFCDDDEEDDDNLSLNYCQQSSDIFVVPLSTTATATLTSTTGSQKVPVNGSDSGGGDRVWMARDTTTGNRGSMAMSVSVPSWIKNKGSVVYGLGAKATPRLVPPTRDPIPGPAPLTASASVRTHSSYTSPNTETFLDKNKNNSYNNYNQNNYNNTNNNYNNTFNQKKFPSSSIPSDVDKITGIAEDEEDLDLDLFEVMGNEVVEKDFRKKPYSIISSVHRLSEDVDVDSMYMGYPLLAAGDSLHVGDVMVYKTLTLCEVTWKPIVSFFTKATVMEVSTSGRSQSQPVLLRTEHGALEQLDMADFAEIRIIQSAPPETHCGDSDGLLGEFEEELHAKRQQLLSLYTEAGETTKS